MAVTVSKSEESVAKIIAFAKSFGEPHITLAMHAALPLGLTPELLHLIRINFVTSAEWIAEADLLLSPLCSEVGGDLYEMDREVRNLLLGEFMNDPDFGRGRVRELAKFLLAYAARQLTKTYNPELRDFFATQQWAAIAYADPEKGAQLLALALAEKLEAENLAGTLRLTSLTQILSAPLLSEEKVLLYAAGVQKLAAGDASGAETMFGSLETKNEAVELNGIILPAPDALNRWIKPAPAETAADSTNAVVPAETTETQGEETASTADGEPLLSSDFKLLREISSNESLIGGIMWSPDGRRLATFSADKLIRIFDAETGELMRLIERTGKKIWSMSWSLDGTMIAGGAEDELFIWDAEKGEQITSSTEKGHIYALAWTPYGELISGSSTGFINTWKIGSSFERTNRSENLGSKIFALCCSPDGRFLGVGLKDKTIRIVERGNSRQTNWLTGHDGWVTSVAWSADGRFFASASIDQTIRLWDTGTWETKFILDGHLEAVYTISFSADSRVLASKSSDGTVRLWDCANGQEIGLLAEKSSENNQYWPTGARLNPHFPTLATSSDNNLAVRLFDVEQLVGAAPAVEQPAPKPKIFLSYKRSLELDSLIAKSVYDGLRERYDVFDENLSTPLGASWTEEIESQLRSCDFFIVLLSPERISKGTVHGELQTIHNLNEERENPADTVVVNISNREPHAYPLAEYTQSAQSVFLDNAEDAPLLAGELAQFIADPENFEFSPQFRNAPETPEPEVKSPSAGGNFSINEWIKFAPQPKPLTSPDQWHVYLSYYSGNRAWALQLYDVLRQQGYKVFLDQYVLKPDDNWYLEFEKALSNSQSAILVWSNDGSDRSWFLREYQVLESAAVSRPGFNFVPIVLDGSPLPDFAASRIYIDFSQYPGGPNGGELLRLLYALEGEPLSSEAAHFANRQNEIYKSAINKIDAAIDRSDGEHLVELFEEGFEKEDSVAWKTYSVLGCKVVDGLIKLNEMEQSKRLGDRLEQFFPLAIRPKQLRALARMDDTRSAQKILAELYAQGARDAETLGIYARTWMDRYDQSGDLNDLRRSRDLYVEAFETAKDDYYTGINAAAKSVLIGEAEDIAKAGEYAARVLKITGTEAKPDDYRLTTIIAEAFLILQNYQAAARLYQAAVNDFPAEVESHLTSRRQALSLIQHLPGTNEDKALIQSVFNYSTGDE